MLLLLDSVCREDTRLGNVLPCSFAQARSPSRRIRRSRHTPWPADGGVSMTWTSLASALPSPLGGPGSGRVRMPLLGTEQDPSTLLGPACPGGPEEPGELRQCSRAGDLVRRRASQLAP